MARWNTARISTLILHYKSQSQMKTTFVIIAAFPCVLVLAAEPSAAQSNTQERLTQPAAQDTLLSEPAISDTTKSARIFLDKVEVLGTVAKPQALFILPGNDPTVDGLTIDRSFFKEIFRQVEWEGNRKYTRRSKARLPW
jgi:hypothetical protein